MFNSILLKISCNSNQEAQAVNKAQRQRRPVAALSRIFLIEGSGLYRSRILYMIWAGNFWMVDIGIMLDPLFFLISRLNNACSPLIFKLQIN